MAAGKAPGVAALEACGTHRHTWDDFLVLNFVVSLLGTLNLWGKKSYLACMFKCFSIATLRLSLVTLPS